VSVGIVSVRIVALDQQPAPLEVGGAVASHGAQTPSGNGCHLQEN